MSVKFRSSSVQMNVAGTNQTVIVVTKPSQVAEGDVMLAVTTQPSTSTTPPSGWTLLGSFLEGSDHESNLYKKIAGASEPADYTWTFGSSSTCGVAISAWMGGHDILHWNARATTAANPSVGRGLDAARDAIAFQCFSWRDSATATMSGDIGTEQFDSVSNNSGATIFRGLAGYTYGPASQADIINAGDTIVGANITQSQAVSFGIHWSILIGDKEPDAETWSSTNGDFAVELNLDVREVDSRGGLVSTFRGDVTSQIAAATSSAGANEDLAHDGLTSTHWFAAAATGWLQYDFGAGVTKTIRRYRLSASASASDRDPMNWTLKGSNNGTDFTVVDTRVNESFGNREQTREFKLNGTPAAYRYYRLDVTANKTSGVELFVRVAEYRLSTIDVWEDITTFVNEESKIRITRGLQGASGRSDFTRAYVELNNTDGRFSLRNTVGEYFGALQRNTQMRISKAFGTKSLQLQGDVQIEGTDVVGDGVRCPMTDSLMITGDMEVRVDFEPDSWRDEQVLCGVSTHASGVAPWRLALLDDGRLEFRRLVGSTELTYTSTESVPMATRQSLKATIDVDNGASGSVARFYYASTIGGSYTQIGASVLIGTAGDTTYDGGALCVGHVGSETGRGIHGLVYNFELYNGIAGTAVTDVDFTALTNGAHIWTDSNSNDWVTVNNAVIANRRYRFHGEVSEWPLAWDPTGTWVTASATGAGVQRRLERGNAPLSTMRRYHTKAIIEDPGAFERFATPFAYWPMEDEKDSFMLASGLPSKGGMQVYGNPDFEGGDADTFKESNPLIKMNGAKFGGRVAGNTSGYADIRWIMYAPTALTASTNFVTLYNTGTIRRITVEYSATNTWIIRGFDEDDSGPIFWNSGTFAVTTIGEPMHCRLILDQNGASVSITFSAKDVYGTSLGSTTDTFIGGTLGRTYRINLNDDGTVSASDLYMGHVALYGEDSPVFAGSELNSHHYETAGDRIKRLCQEEAIDFRHSGALSESAFMGFQESDAPFAAMSSAAVSDDGYLIDPLDAFGIEYKTGRSTFNQAAHLELSYTSGELSGELHPVGDDSYIVNDFTASRGEAGSARYQRTDGPLSVEPPPLGVGPYDDEQSYSLAHEGQCVDIASWQVHKGTLDEERYPRIELALENLRITADSALTERILMLDVGDRVDITDTPAFLPADDIRQLVIGYEEWFDNFQHNFTLNAIPERAFETARYDSEDRFAGHDSTLYQDVTAAASTLEVVNDTGMAWSETASDFDIVVNGERMTVTAVANITASYSTDTFNRANSTTTLGSTDGGTVSAWTAQVNTWGINTNTAYIPTTGNAIATIPGSADFEEVSVTVSTWPAATEAWINFRYTDTNNRWRWGGTLADDARLEKVVAGVVTSIDADPSGNDFVLAQGDKLTARAHGSVIEVFINDVLALCVSDTFNESSTLVGMQTDTNSVRLDNFVWISSTPRQTFTVTRGVGPSTGAYHKAGAEIALYKTPYRGL